MVLCPPTPAGTSILLHGREAGHAGACVYRSYEEAYSYLQRYYDSDFKIYQVQADLSDTYRTKHRRRLARDALTFPFPVLDILGEFIRLGGSSGLSSKMLHNL